VKQADEMGKDKLRRSNQNQNGALLQRTKESNDMWLQSTFHPQKIYG